MKNKEFRAALPGSAEVREEEGRQVVQGYAALFNSRTQILDFWEQIAPGAFTQALANNDVVALYNHNHDCVLGRTSSGTLKLWEDDRGLKYECDLPNTTCGRDLVVTLGRKDINGCSFGFWSPGPGDEDITTLEDGTILRTLKNIDVFEVTLGCTFPAYEDTTVSLRSRMEAEAKNNEPKLRNYFAKKWIEVSYL